MILQINRKRLINGLKFKDKKINFRLIKFTKERHHNPSWLYVVTFDITIGQLKRTGVSHALATNRENVNIDEVIKLAVDYYIFLEKKIESVRVR